MYVMNAILDLVKFSSSLGTAGNGCRASVPLALTTIELELDVINSVRWSVFASLLFLGNELLSESVVVLF